MSTDRFPQVLTIKSAAITINDYDVTVVSLPMSRMASRPGQTIAMEILNVDYYLNIADLGDVSSSNFAYLTSATSRNTADVATAATLDADLGLPRTFAGAYVDMVTTGFRAGPQKIVLNDGAGNGFLYVGDTLTMVAGNVGGTAAGTAVAKVLYRWVHVNNSELFGVLQGQQAVVT